MRIPSIDHSIQREILRRLALIESQRFSQLKPEGMESNVFTYHLHQLIKNGCVEKANSEYRLGLNGLRYAHNVNNGDFRLDREPKIIAVIILTNSRGEVLLVHRHKQPYINQYMFISGRQYFGEKPSDHAKRELTEKTGLQGITLTRRGLIDNRVRDTSGEVITHIIGHVYSGAFDGQTPEDTVYWSFSWHTPAALHERTLPLLPGTAELYETIQDNAADNFFASSDFIFDQAE